MNEGTQNLTDIRLQELLKEYHPSSRVYNDKFRLGDEYRDGVKYWKELVKELVRRKK